MGCHLEWSNQTKLLQIGEGGNVLYLKGKKGKDIILDNALFVNTGRFKPDKIKETLI